MLCLTFTEAGAQAAAVGQGPRVSLGSDPKSGHRHVKISGAGNPTYPTVDLSCDGKRWTLSLTRSEDGAVYSIPPARAELMLNAVECRLFLPAQEIKLSREQLWAAWASPTQGAGAPNLLVGQVVDVIDGNTILVNLGDRSETVRYIGINALETNRRPPAAAPAPGETLLANRQLVARQQVRMELDTVERDRDGRLLAYVYVADRMVNAELVRRGSAEVMTVQPNVRHRDLLVTLEQEARDNRRGLWADPAEPTTPTTVEARPSQVSEARRGVAPENAWACPAQQPIKGQYTTYTGGGRCVYHLPDGDRYSATKADRCYATAEDARHDGCVASRR
ncbi:MAG: thermonuclease family protein [Candidatus Rokuibacteriota bacterium]